MPETPPLTEIARRRPDFSPGEWVTLGDGERWCFPELWAEPTTIVGSDGAIPSLNWRIGRPSCPVAEAAFEAVQGSIMAASLEVLDRRIIGFGVELGAAILQRNYRLTHDDGIELFTLGFWLRGLEDRRAFDQMIEFNKFIQRIGIDSPAKSIGKLLASIPTNKQWQTPNRNN